MSYLDFIFYKSIITKAFIFFKYDIKMSYLIFYKKTIKVCHSKAKPYILFFGAFLNRKLIISLLNFKKKYDMI